MYLRRAFDLLRTSRRGARDVLVSMAPQLVGVLTGFAASVLMARGLGPEGLGRYALVMSLAGMAASLSDLGLGQTAIRYAARSIAAGQQDLQFAVMRWAFRMRMVLVLLITAAFMLAAPVVARNAWHDPALAPYIRLGLLGGCFTALGAIPTLYFQSLRRFGVNAAIQSAQRIFFFLGIAVIAWCSAWSLTHVLYAQLLAGAAAAMAFLAMVPRRAIWQKNEDGGRGGTFWKAPAVDQHVATHELDRQSVHGFAFYQMISTLTVLLTLQADVWLMGYFLDQEQLGIYSAASRFALPLTIVLGGLNTALWPRASALRTLSDTRRLLQKTFGVSLGIAAAGTAYSLAAPLLAPWLFGEAYSGGILIGQLLCLRTCLSILICPVGVVGYSLGLVRVYWLINVVQLALVVGLNVVLLPRLGPLGAAVALVANDLAGLVLAGWLILRRISAPSTNASQETNHA